MCESQSLTIHLAYLVAVLPAMVVLETIKASAMRVILLKEHLCVFTSFQSCVSSWQRWNWPHLEIHSLFDAIEYWYGVYWEL